MIPVDYKNVMMARASSTTEAGMDKTCEHCYWLAQTICTHLDCHAVHLGPYFIKNKIPPCGGRLFERRAA